MPAEGLAFLISAIKEILSLLMLFCIFPFKSIIYLFSEIFSFEDCNDIDFFNKSIR